jgi:hypothetical protein
MTPPIARRIWYFAQPSNPYTDTLSVPHLLLGLHVGATFNQSLDNLRVSIHGSPDQGRPALLQDEKMSRGRLALSDKAEAIMIGILRIKFWEVIKIESYSRTESTGSTSAISKEKHKIREAAWLF